jgi:hypothetical protein
MQDVLSFEELEDPDGGPPRRFSVVGAQFEPLSYDELAGLKGPATLRLRFHSGRVIDTDIPGIDSTAGASGHALVQFLFSSQAYGLVNGGWLPSALASHSGALVMPDRCVVSDIRGRFENGERKPSREPDVIDMFANSDIRIHPAFFALEGNSRRTPTALELEEQWREAHKVLKAALPRAKIPELTPAYLAGMQGILRDTNAEFQNDQRFLMQVGPGLVSPVAHARRFDKAANIIAIADSLGVASSSLALVAALSTVFVPNGASPAKKLLKVRPTYSTADAYNALVDLRALSMLMKFFALFPRERAMFCTTDRELALFWVGLNAADFRFTGQHMTFNLTPVPLFPGLERQELRDLLRLA